MIAQLPSTRMPEEIPNANISAEINSHKLKVINIKLIELIKKPKNIKTFSANFGKFLILGMITSGLSAWWMGSIRRSIQQALLAK